MCTGEARSFFILSVIIQFEGIRERIEITERKVTLNGMRSNFSINVECVCVCVCAPRMCAWESKRVCARVCLSSAVRCTWEIGMALFAPRSSWKRLLKYLDVILQKCKFCFCFRAVWKGYTSRLRGHKSNKKVIIVVVIKVIKKFIKSPLV